MKKTLRLVAFISFVFFLLFNAWVVFTGKSFFYKALVYNFADIDDYKIFDNRLILKSTSPIPWNYSRSFSKNKLSPSVYKQLDSLESVALLVIEKDSISYEYYFGSHTDSTLSNSFSMAKSFVSALVGIALQEGKIKSIDQPVADFLPEFSVGEKKNITIKHLLMMSSGLNWEETYASPFSTTTEAYYGSDLKAQINKLEVVEAPGKNFRYKSGDTQLLSFVLEKATGKKIADYASEKLWRVIGCERNGLWSLDKEGGNEKAYCCINSTAKDFAKLGKLYLDSGRVNGKQIVSLEYLLASVQPTLLIDGDSNGQFCDFYGYQWWVIQKYKGKKVFYARGILGQYIIVVPESELIIVRLGKQRGAKIGSHYQEVYSMLEEFVK